MKILIVGSDLAMESTMEFYSKRALEALGHSVEYFDYLKSPFLGQPEHLPIKSILKSVFRVSPRKILPIYSWIERLKINRNLISFVLSSKPDFMLVFKGAPLLPKTILKIKEELNIPIVNWLPENPFAFLQDDIYPVYDCLFMPDTYFIPLLYQKGAKRVEYLAFACDPELHKHIELTNEEKRYYTRDVCFIGSWYHERERILEEFLDFDIFISGPNWNRIKSNSRLKGRCINERLSLEEWRKYYCASKIVLGLPNPHFVNGLIMREFETPACRAFLITNETKDIARFFDVGNEVVIFNKEEELKDLIEFYLKNDDLRNKIASQGQKKVYAEHTYIKRMEKILSVVEELKNK